MTIDTIFIDALYLIIFIVQPAFIFIGGSLIAAAIVDAIVTAVSILRG